MDGCYEHRWVICESAMPRPHQEGARHAWTEITHAQDTRLAAFTCRRHVQTEGCGQPIDRCDCVRRARRAGLSWPLPENLSDEALERILYPPPKVIEGSATAARLGRNPSRTAPTWRDATAVVGGASQRLPRRLWLFELCWDRNYVARGRLALMGS